MHFKILFIATTLQLCKSSFSVQSLLLTSWMAPCMADTAVGE